MRAHKKGRRALPREGSRLLIALKSFLNRMEERTGKNSQNRGRTRGLAPRLRSISREYLLLVTHQGKAFTRHASQATHAPHSVGAAASLSGNSMREFCCQVSGLYTTSIRTACAPSPMMGTDARRNCQPRFESAACRSCCSARRSLPALEP